LGGSPAGSTVSGSSHDFADSLTERFPACTRPDEAETWRAEMLMLINQERSARGIATLSVNATLESQAEQYACELIEFDFFAHENPVTGSTLGDRAEEFGYDFLIVGENLAAGQTTPQQAMAQLMDSAGHRANILDTRFTEVGLGVRTGGTYGTYWVQEFGAPFRPVKANKP